MEIRVGERIRALREKSGVTQDRLREVLGLENLQNQLYNIRGVDLGCFGGLVPFFA